MDLHDTPFGAPMPFTPEHKKANSPPAGDWYEIPYRCLVPREVEGMLVAGRCISSDREANGSLRAMPTCMFTGEAAGVAAALGLRRGVTPHELDGRLPVQNVVGGGRNAAGHGESKSEDALQHGEPPFWGFQAEAESRPVVR